MPFLALTLVFCYHIACKGQDTWTERNILRENGSKFRSVIKTASATICTDDLLDISWRIQPSSANEKHYVAIANFGNSLAAGLPIISKEGKIEDGLSMDNFITCELNELHCTPTISQLLTDSKTNKLLITFENQVSQPNLSTKSQIETTLDIHPPLEESAVAEWVNSNQMDIVVSKEYLDTMLKLHGDGQYVGVKVRDWSLANTILTGSISLRANHEGVMEVFIADASTDKQISNALQITVQDCSRNAKQIVDIPNLRREHHEEAAVKPFMHMKGVLAVNGQHAVRLAEDVHPALKHGTWSVSLWMRLLGPPTGSFRSFFYKGDGHSTHRTPSAWLLPDSNRFTVRVSTERDSDLGGETTIPVELGKWTLVCFVFENATDFEAAKAREAEKLLDLTYGGAAAAAESARNGRRSKYRAGTAYQLSVYVNGELDVQMRFGDAVTVNDQSISFFKDVSHRGPEMLVGDMRLWDGALDMQQVEKLHSAGLSVLERSHVDDMVALLQSTNNTLFHSSSLHRGEPSPSADHSITALALVGQETALESAVAGTDSKVIELLLQRAKESLANCEPWDARLDLYAEAAERGSAEGLYYWGMLMRYGNEGPESTCGVNSQHAAGGKEELGLLQQEQAALAFLYSVDMGYSKALTPLANVILTGIGIDPLLNSDRALPLDVWRVPLPSRFVSQSAGKFFLSAAPLHRRLSDHLRRGIVDCDNSTSTWMHGNSVLCPFSNQPYSPTSAAIGLLHIAALKGEADAQAALSYRYQHGFGVLQDIETAAQYAIPAVEAASESYHRVGNQPVIESDRINDKTAREIEKGNLGNDDELIQHQILRASEGHVPSMLAMGDLYYYGARGMPRDQPAALRYYEQAAAQGNPEGMCGAAGMLIKGEGAAVNVTRAISLYENASSMGSVRANNGLGYLYYFGTSLPKNATKAFRYFQEAAKTNSDSDSVFNTAYCLEHGTGTERNMKHAINWYTLAATQMGHFDSTKALGGIYMEGKGTARSSHEAMKYLAAARNIGPWASWLRRGLDQYLNEEYYQSLSCYAEAAELGYEVSQNNAAYVIRAKLNSKPRSKVLSLPYHALSTAHSDSFSSQVTAGSLSALESKQYALAAFHGSKDAYLRLGTCYFKGSCGLAKNYECAQYWYMRASHEGVALASIYLGVMHHYGVGGVAVNLDRAKRYYMLSLEHEQNLDQQLQILVKGLLKALSWQPYSVLLAPLNMGVEYAVKALWG